MSEILNDPIAFSEALYRIMPELNPGIKNMALYEFRYCLNNITPADGWPSIKLDSKEEIVRRTNDPEFFESIRIKDKVADKIILDQKIVRLANQLLVGLITGDYPVAWINHHFYFDIRSFFFYHRTRYFTEEVLAHFGGKPYRQFEPLQNKFDSWQDLGYQAFSAANKDLDELFMESVKKIIPTKKPPVLMGIAGPTAAGKTEIVERLRQTFEKEGLRTTAIELDNFLTDRDQREEKGIHSKGKEAIHFDLLLESLENITNGLKINIPRYDFIDATSSHNLDGTLKSDGVPIEIEPADIIFMEGNFPFLLEKVVPYIDIKVVYLTDDHVRLKRKWKRDIDYRKKYEPTYFQNRYFKSQFIMKEFSYLPQMQVSDLTVFTTGGALWTSPEIAAILDQG